jgi:protein-S-isoprenylcysteine O-methyltransferase Ste14
MSQSTEPLEEGPKVRLNPPMLVLGALAAGYLVRLFVGGRLPLPRAFAEGLGGLLIIIGLGLVMGAVNQFNHKAERLRPQTPSRTLVTEGVYKFSRNPIYLGMMIFGAGFGVATSNVWIIISTTIAGAILHFFVILPEEAYLEEKFGADYQEFRRRVRRWI